MSMAAHQEKEKNEKTGKRKAGQEKKKQSTDVIENVCCLSAVVQRAARRKNGLYKEVPGVTETIEKANSHFDPTQTGWTATTTLRRLLIGAEIHYLAIPVGLS